MSTTVFTILPTTQAVIDEVREWMSEHPLASWSRARVAWHDDGYPNSTPVDVVPDGWEKTCADGYKKGPAKIAGIMTGKGSISIQIDLDDCWSSTFYCVDTLPEAFAAAESMMERLGLLAPKPDADGWHKTDGIAPPGEAGDRVIETVDGHGGAFKHPATHDEHMWGGRFANDRPIKWRYADGGGE
jgi:hypothetical protein